MLPSLLLAALLQLVLPFFTVGYECNEMLHHVGTLSRAARLPDPRKLHGFSNKVCRNFSEHLHSRPGLADNIVNLANFYDGRRGLDVSPDEVVVDVAAERRRKKKQYQLEHRRNLGAVATSIDTCPSVQTECPHVPCTPAWLEFPATTTYVEPTPAYGGSLGFELATFALENLDDFCANIIGVYSSPLIDLNDELDLCPAIWSGNVEDRTNAAPVGVLLILKEAGAQASIISEALSDLLPDDRINICFFSICFPLPNPIKAILEVVVTLLKNLKLIVDALYEQAEYVDGIVDGAEIEAGYELSVDLLQKDCAIYGQVVCRCASNPSPVYGQGCDGVDSNCNDEVDECDEDEIPPEISVTNILDACDGVFQNEDEALECILNTVDVVDDCQETTFDCAFLGGTCEGATFSCDAADACGNSVTGVTVSAFVDAGNPTVQCSLTNEVEPSGVLQNVGLEYIASDPCGREMNVTVEVYSNEIEDFNAQQMAVFFTNRGGDGTADLYVAGKACATSSNGQCIQDPDYNKRIYEVLVTAVNSNGGTETASCSLEVEPKGNGGGNGKNNIFKTSGNPDNSKQRFLLSTFTSIVS